MRLVLTDNYTTTGSSRIHQLVKPPSPVQRSREGAPGNEDDDEDDAAFLALLRYKLRQRQP